MKQIQDYEAPKHLGGAYSKVESGVPNLDDVKKLRSIIGKHVYNKDVDGTVQLIME